MSSDMHLADRAARRPLHERPDGEREQLAEDIADRLDPILTALGITFLLVVLAESFAQDNTTLARWLAGIGWGLWTVFVGEWLFRLYVAPSRLGFLKRNWWQLVFLVLPFLRFVRVIRAARAARTGRVISSAVRAGRTATSRLAGRIGWLATVTTMVVLAAAQLLYEFGGYEVFGAALHDAAYGAITGEPLSVSSGWADVLEIFLAIYSVCVFAALAAGIGAFFLESKEPQQR